MPHRKVQQFKAGEIGALVLSVKCLNAAGERLTLASKGAFVLQISEIAREEGAAASTECSF